MLEARDIAVVLGGARVVAGVSLALAPGEMVAVVGPNGAGKSTLLRALAGTATLAGGSVTLDGMPLAAWPRRALARRRAVLSQSCSLGFPFRVHEVVRLGRSGSAGHTGRDQDAAAVSAAMHAADVAPFAERTATALSGGEQQRVHLARVLAQIWPEQKPTPRRKPSPLEGEGLGGGSSAGTECAATPHPTLPLKGGGLSGSGRGSSDARYLLLDEPTASLDIAHQHHVLGVAWRLARGGMGVLAVLHDLNLAALYADRVCVMAEGRVVALGSPAEALSAETVTAVFRHPVVAVARPGDGRHALLPLPAHR